MTQGILIRKALASLAKAYAPYSHFRVGAALETRRGRIYAGCNVENSSFGLTICAERAAVCAAVEAGDHDFVRIAIVTSRSRGEAPCGACRQVLAEFSEDMEVLLVGRQRVESVNLSDLLPKRFHLKERRSRKRKHHG